MEIKSVSIDKLNNGINYERYKKTREVQCVNTVGFGKKHDIPNKKIDFKEGMEILGIGIKRQLHDTFMALFGSFGAILRLVGFTVGLSLFPLIGIPTAVGGGVLAIGFAGISVFNAVKHSVDFVKNNKSGQYDIARRNLETLGEDTVDLALSVPFVPKAVSKTRTFIKHGKIGLNKEFFDGSDSATKFRKLFSGKLNNELERKMFHNQAIHTELKSLKDISEEDVAKLEKWLQDYNVEFDKIPDVVLEHWAVENGVSAKPYWFYETLPKNTVGYAIGSDCKILLTDFKSTVPPKDKFVLLEQKTVGDKYSYTYQEVSTGKLIQQMFPKSVADEAANLSARYHASSAQMRRILTVLHEREHVDQFARLIMEKGNNSISPTPKSDALDIYNRMIADIKAKGVSLEKSNRMAKIIAYSEPRVGTYAEYINRPAEIYARQAEIDALNNPYYQHLENVYKKVNSNVKPSSELAMAMLNTVRYESLVS